MKPGGSIPHLQGLSNNPQPYYISNCCRACSQNRGRQECFQNFKQVAKPTGKRPLGKPRRRWEDNIRMDLEEIGINAGNWVNSAQDRDYWRALVNAALNLRIS